MNLDLTPDQTLMRDEARRVLAERSSSAAVRKVVDAGSGFDRDLWRTVGEELGWCGIAIAESRGGLGLGATELALLMEEAGRRLACIPLWSTVCHASPLIAALGSEKARSSLLPRIAAGKRAVAVALPRIDSDRPLAEIAVSAKRSGEGYVLSGTVAHVADLPSAALVLVPARLTDGGLALFALASDTGMEIHPLQTLDATRPFGRLALEGIAVPAEARVDAGGLTEEGFARPLLWAKVGLAAEEIGAAQGAFELTLDHIGERVQFGRTIASFQAIKHRCARLVVDIAEARSLLYGVASRLSGEDESDEVALEAEALRALSAALAAQAAEEAIQLHGGAGMTWEYDPHLYLKRAQTTRFIFGSDDARLGQIADALIGEAAA